MQVRHIRSNRSTFRYSLHVLAAEGILQDSANGMQNLGAHLVVLLTLGQLTSL